MGSSGVAATIWHHLEKGRWLRGGRETGADSAPSTPSPDVDYNVLSQPSNLLVIILCVALNTLLALAFRTIYAITVKLRRKVRQR